MAFIRSLAEQHLLFALAFPIFLGEFAKFFVTATGILLAPRNILNKESVQGSTFFLFRSLLVPWFLQYGWPRLNRPGYDKRDDLPKWGFSPVTLAAFAVSRIVAPAAAYFGAWLVWASIPFPALVVALVSGEIASRVVILVMAWRFKRAQGYVKHIYYPEAKTGLAKALLIPMTWWIGAEIQWCLSPKELRQEVSWDRYFDWTMRAAAFTYAGIGSAVLAWMLVS